MTPIPDFSDVQILARTAYGENRGGGSQGMQSVLNVIMNRAKKPRWWGKTPREVCLKPYQFSCWLKTDPNLATIRTVTEATPLFSVAVALATKALAGELEDITKGATYYYAKSMKKPPAWAEGKTPCAVIASQLFFNNID